jgi:hypothetical protein
MSTEKTIVSRSFWAIIIGGMLTGMGNGSVFGAALMCLMGRGGFANWGGAGMDQFNPATFHGFIDWCMLVFGFAFIAILVIGLNRHDQMERQAAH